MASSFPLGNPKFHLAHTAQDASLKPSIMAHIFFTILAPIFALVAAGWCLDRKFRLDLDTLVKLNIYAFVPCFIFVHVLGSPVVGSLALRIVAFTATIISCMALLSWLLAGSQASRVRRCKPCN